MNGLKIVKIVTQLLRMAKVAHVVFKDICMQNKRGELATVCKICQRMLNVPMYEKTSRFLHVY